MPLAIEPDGRVDEYGRSPFARRSRQMRICPRRARADFATQLAIRRAESKVDESTAHLTNPFR